MTLPSLRSLVTALRRSPWAPLLLLVLAAAPARGQTGGNVLVIANAASSASTEIASYYAQKRGVPDAQILRLTLPTTDEISRDIYALAIERQVADWILSNSAQDRILYIVLTKDVPLRITGTVGQDATIASVDSESLVMYSTHSINSCGVPLPTLPQTYASHPIISQRFMNSCVPNVFGSITPPQCVLMRLARLSIGPIPSRQ